MPLLGVFAGIHDDFVDTSRVEKSVELSDDLNEIINAPGHRMIMDTFYRRVVLDLYNEGQIYSFEWQSVQIWNEDVTAVTGPWTYEDSFWLGSTMGVETIFGSLEVRLDCNNQNYPGRTVIEIRDPQVQLVWKDIINSRTISEQQEAEGGLPPNLVQRFEDLWAHTGEAALQPQFKVNVNFNDSQSRFVGTVPIGGR